MQETDRALPPELLDALTALTPASIEDLEALSVTAWNGHYRLRLGGELRHLVVYRLPDPTALGGLRFEHDLLRRLSAAGFTRLPALWVPEGQDSSLLPFPGGWFAVTDWIEGCRGQDDPPVTGRQLESMAEGLGELHGALGRLEMRLDYHPDHVFVYPLPAFLAQREMLVERLEGRLDDFGAEASAAWERSKGAILELLEGFPVEAYERAWAAAAEQGHPRIVHGDFRPLNAAFQGEELSCILDYNCCFNELRLWDLAYTALGLGGKETIGGRLDPEPVARFIAAYHAATPLSSDERHLLPAFLSFVPAKLMVGAVADWWLTDRDALLLTLTGGAAEEIVRSALG